MKEASPASQLASMPTSPEETHTRSSGPDDLSAELAPLLSDYLTSIDFNHILGNLFQLLAANRVSPARASTLAFICSQLLRSQKIAEAELRLVTIEMHRDLLQVLKAKYCTPPKKSNTDPSTASRTPS